MLVTVHKAFGNLQIHDLRTFANLNVLRPVFHRLDEDPYIKCVLKRETTKQVSWFRREDPTKKDSLQQINGPVLLSHQFTSHDDGRPREFPPVRTLGIQTHVLLRALHAFSAAANVPYGSDIEVRMQRQAIYAADIAGNNDEVQNGPKNNANNGVPETSKTTTTNNDNELHPPWQQHGANCVGMICVSREDITGGLHQFRNAAEKEIILQMELSPGFMTVFRESDGISHRSTPLELLNPYVKDHTTSDKDVLGYQDIVMMSF